MLFRILVASIEHAGIGNTLIATLWGGIRSEIVAIGIAANHSDQQAKAFNPHRHGSGTAQQVFSETGASEKTYRVMPPAS